MTEPTSNAHAAIEAELVCPSCGAANAPFRTYCAWDAQTGDVFCLICSHAGTLATFQPTPLPEGEY
jgi:uncharacterized OB-fold protein